MLGYLSICCFIYSLSVAYPFQNDDFDNDNVYDLRETQIILHKGGAFFL